MKKILIISGGISKERAISLDTGKQVAKELKKNNYFVKIAEPNFQLFDVIKKLNKKITPKEIAIIRKQFRSPIIARSIYSEVLNIIQPIVIYKLKKRKDKKNRKYLEDALLTSIAGISAAMKNTG